MTPGGMAGYGSGHVSATALAASAAAAGDMAAVKARRKRIFKIGGKKDDSPEVDHRGGVASQPGSGSSSPLASPPASRTELRSNPDNSLRYRSKPPRPTSPGSVDAASARQWRSSSVIGGGGGTASLTGMASKVMARPTYVRAPDTRMSYGFPSS